MEKGSFSFRRFAHRRNADASFDSVCLACLLTVGTAMVDVALSGLRKRSSLQTMGAGQLSHRTRLSPSLSTPKGNNRTISCPVRQASSR
jgi:hypothetical protein